MLPATFPPIRSNRLRALALVSLLCLAAAGPLLLGQSSAAPSAGEDFGAYLAGHQGDIAPFFDAHGQELLKDAFPFLLELSLKIMIIVLAVGWFLDVLLARGFSSVFAPAYARMGHALLYATGRLVLSLLLSVLLAFVVLLGLNVLGQPLLTVVVYIVLLVPSLFAQMIWVSYLYRSPMVTAGVFYIALVVIHSVAIGFILPFAFVGTIKGTATAYMDRKMTPALQAEADRQMVQAAADETQRDGVQARTTDLTARLAQAQTDEHNLQKAILERAESAPIVFARLVKLRAHGDLVGARSQLADFLKKFPNDALTGAAKGQLAETDQALSVQTAQQKQAEAAKAAAAAQARAALLAKAAAGRLSLSEMRAVLLDRTPSEVSDLLGPPDDTASQRWGYARHMIYNPVDKVQLGLTVVFADGLVQGVDYYYGDGR